MTTVTEGTNVSLVETFLDEYDQPVIPHERSKGPRVRLYDKDKALIAEAYASIDSSEPGAWRVELPIPKMGLQGDTRLRVRWKLKSEDGETYRNSEWITVGAASEERQGDITAIIGRDIKLSVALPFSFDEGTPKREANPALGLPAVPARAGDYMTFSIYRNNEPLMENLPWNDPAVTLMDLGGRTLVHLPNPLGKQRLAPSLLLIDYLPKGAFTATQFTFKVWAVTPQVLVAAQMLEGYINKARLENVIPSLDYTQSDLFEYLSRGLNLFNSLPPQLSNFNGMNMQGMILDAWLNCSAYYALAAQLQAEGAMAFDFSGQAVSLNVDRTPSIESALGRIESTFDSYIKPTKKLLARAGVNSGDGSQGGNFIDGRSALGALSIINAPTTRAPWPANNRRWSTGLI